MTALWTAEDAVAATGGVATTSWTASGVSIDSRTVAPGDLFVAIRGEINDGHAHVAEALAKGAVAAMVAADAAITAGSLLQVPDTLAGLWALAAAARARTGARVVAVTGSVGKTGTKEMLATSLAAFGATHANAGNLNNHFGAPLSLARMPATSGYGVFELGMNHPGEIAPLSTLVRPAVAVITTVGTAHLEYFRDVVGIADEKAAVMDGLAGPRIAVLPRDSSHFVRLAGHAVRRGAGTIATFGADPAADARLIHAASDADGVTVDAAIRGRPLRFRVGAPGQHWALNALAVLAAIDALGLDVAVAAAELAKVGAPKGRGLRRRLNWTGGQITLVDDSYNASPQAVRAALSTLSALPMDAGGRRVFVFADMLELGPTAAAQHRDLAGDVLAAGIDRIHVAGPHATALHAALPAERRGAAAADAAALEPSVLADLRAGDIVLVKGSLGMGIGRVVHAIQATAERLG